MSARLVRLIQREGFDAVEVALLCFVATLILFMVGFFALWLLIALISAPLLVGAWAAGIATVVGIYVSWLVGIYREAQR